MIGGYDMSRKSGDDAALGCVVQVLLIAFLLPLVGLYLATKKDATEDTRAIGWGLFAVGIAIWIFFAIIKAG